MGDFHSACDAASQAVQAARQAGDPLLMIQALADQAQATTLLGDTATGIRQIQDTLDLARTANNLPMLAFVLARANFIYGQAADLARTIPVLNEKLAIEQQLGNRYEEAYALSSLGSSFIALGMYPEARDALQRSLQINQSLGARRVFAYNLLNLGEVSWLCGENKAARGYLDQALAEMLTFHDKWGEGAVWKELGHSLMSDDPQAAIEQFARSEEIFGEMDALPARLSALAERTRCLLTLGRIREARTCAEELWDHLRANGAAGIGTAMRAYQTCADVFEGAGDSATARAIIDAGYQELGKMAARISDSHWRQSFLENDPFNREMTARYKAINPRGTIQLD